MNSSVLARPHPAGHWAPRTNREAPTACRRSRKTHRIDLPGYPADNVQLDLSDVYSGHLPALIDGRLLRRVNRRLGLCEGQSLTSLDDGDDDAVATAYRPACASSTGPKRSTYRTACASSHWPGHPAAACPPH